MRLLRLFVLAAMLILAACSGSAPRIESLRWRIVYRDDGNSRFEELIVYVLANDPDGSGDLAAIHVISEDNNLLWTVQSTDWQKKEGNGPGWIGLPGMVMHIDGPLPDTLYTVRVEDLAGRYDELTFRPDTLRPAVSEIVWPQLSIRGQVLQINPPYQSGGTMFLRDQEQKVIDYFSVINGSTVPAREAVSWELWIPLDDQSSGILMGPYPFSSDAE